MNAVTPTVATDEPAAAILAEFEADAGIVLTDPAKGAAFYAACVAEVEGHTPDVSTPKGREALTSLAYKIRRRSAAIDKARLALTKGWRDLTATVNAAGKDADAKYEALAVKARKPLDDWQAEEDAKAARIKAAFDYLQNAPVVLAGDTYETLEARLAAVRVYTLPNDFTEEQRDGCERLRATAIAALTTAIAEAKQKEQDAADLKRLRDAEAARLAAAPKPPISEPLAELTQAISPLAAPAPPPPPASAEPSALLTALGLAKADLMKVCGLDEPTAKAVVLAIGREQVAHLTLTLESRNAG